MKKVQSYILILLFLILIFGCSIATLFHRDREFSDTENRSLAQMPVVTLDTVLDGSFESDYEEYLTDQFFARDDWLSLKTDVERVTGHTMSNDIFFADDGYLIEAHTGTFTSEQAQQNISLLANFAGEYLDQFGNFHMTVMIIPNAVDILREKLPAFASPFDEEDYLLEVKDALPEDVWFDAGSVLREHSGEEIYYRTDHHWKTLGAFYVYQAWAKKEGLPVSDLTDYEIETVTESFEGTVQSKLGIHTVKDTIEVFHDPDAPSVLVKKDESGEFSDTLYDESALQTKNQYEYFLGGNTALVKIATNAQTGRRILIVKDSYANCFIPFLLSDFDEIDALDIRYYDQPLHELIEKEGYTDLLFLYNASGFAEDTSLAKLLN